MCLSMWNTNVWEAKLSGYFGYEMLEEGSEINLSEEMKPLNTNTRRRALPSACAADPFWGLESCLPCACTWLLSMPCGLTFWLCSACHDCRGWAAGCYEADACTKPRRLLRSWLKCRGVYYQAADESVILERNSTFSSMWPVLLWRSIFNVLLNLGEEAYILFCKTEKAGGYEAPMQAGCWKQKQKWPGGAEL